MKKKYITKLMIAACLSSALSLNSCIEEVFPESSTATIDQIGKSDQAISAMVNSVVAFINAFRSYGPQFYHDFGYSGYNLIRESACEDFFCHEPKFDFFDTYGVCNDLGDADVVNTIWYYNVSIRPRACFFPLFSFLPLWLHYNLNPLCVQY